MTFRASVVLFETPQEELENIVLSLLRCQHLEAIDLVDNSSAPIKDFDFLRNSKVNYIFNGKNLGYGRGHNVSISQTLGSKASHHLVINADVEIISKDIDHLYEVMVANSNVGLLMPNVIYPDGQRQYLCKFCPSPIDLFGRLVLPRSLALKWLRKFDMRDFNFDWPTFVPYLSGCFMFLSAKALAEVGAFDARFFLYPEDIDLSRRIAYRYEALFYPDVTITHRHDAASKKSFKMMVIHIREIIKYFNKWGWIFDKKRRVLNRRCGENIPLKI